MIDEILKKEKLPKDELDDFWNNFMGFLPVGMLLFCFAVSLFGEQTETTITVESKLLYFGISLLLFLYTLWVKSNERNLKTINTGLSKSQNEKVISKIEIENSWAKISKKSGYSEFEIPLVFGKPGHKLIIINIDNTIYYNLRNIGSHRGRMPYLFGIDSIKEYNIKREIHSYIKQAV